MLLGGIVPCMFSGVQFSLGNKPWQPCYVVRLEGITVMMDCALDLSVLLNFLPLPLVYRYVPLPPGPRDTPIPMHTLL